MRPRWWHLHVVLGLASAVVLALILGGGHAALRSYRVGGPHGTPAVTLTVPKSVAQQTAVALDTHQNARDETPAGAPAAVVDAAQQQDARLAASDKLPPVFPDAAPQQRGCITHLVQDYSSRNGVAPRAFVLHYTVSPNVPGWADVNAVVGIFNNWAYQASSNYVIDGEGNCAYIVRETDKAWTQAAANPVAISVEVIDTGHEATYMAPAGMRKLAMVVSDALARWHIPVQLAAFENGVLTRPGIIDHRMLGVAGGGHFDIDPIVNGHFDDQGGLRRTLQVIAAVKAFRLSEEKPAPKPRLTAAQRRARARAIARKQVLALRLKGESWQQIKAGPIYRRFVALGGH